MSDIAKCRACGSFAMESINLGTGYHYVHCFNEFSSEDFDCTAPPSLQYKDGQKAIEAWNKMQQLGKLGDTK